MNSKLETRIAKLEKLLSKRKPVKNESKKAERIGRDILNKLDDAQSMLNDLVDYLDDIDSDYAEEVNEISENLLSAFTALQEIVPML